MKSTESGVDKWKKKVYNGKENENSTLWRKHGRLF